MVYFKRAEFVGTGRGPQSADPGLVLGAPAEVAVPVYRSACLQVFRIAGLEFVCTFWTRRVQGSRYGQVPTDARMGLISKPEVIARAFPEPGERGFDILESGSASLRPSFTARSTRAFYLD